MRRVGAFGQVDTNRIVLPFGLIVLAKLIAQARSLDAHDGVYDGIERFGPLENLESDVVALEPITATGQRLVDDVLKKPLPALRLMERTALNNAGQVFANSLLLGFAPAIKRNFRHSQLQAHKNAQARQHQGAVRYCYILGPFLARCHPSPAVDRTDEPLG